MGKKIIVNERVLKHILMEMTKETTLINEAISVANAYAKFYSTKLTEEEYNAAVKGTTNMTPFHKALLDCMIQAKEHQSWDWTLLGKDCGEIWANADANIRQLLLKAVKSKELNPKDPNGFYEKTIEISQTKAATKAQVANNGLITLYEDNEVLITCTTTYSASHKFYADSHWCTASDIYGQYNGYCMFHNYAIRDESCLIQIVPKNDREWMYQMQYGKFGPGQICNFEDDGCSFDEMIDVLENKVPNIRNILDNLTTSDKINKLIERTEVECGEDSKYWIPKTEERIAELTEEINQKVNLNDYEQTIRHMLGKCVLYRNNCDNNYDNGVSVVVFTSGDFNAPYFLLKYEIDLDEVLSSEASSWMWSCKRIFNSATQSSIRFFLCNMTKYDQENAETDFEIVRRIDDYYTNAFGVTNVVGYCTKSDDKGYIYTVISEKTGENIFTNEYVERFTTTEMILGVGSGPYKIFNLRNMKIVLSNITQYYINWGDIYVTSDEIAKSPRSNTRGFLDLQSAIRYFGQ